MNSSLEQRNSAPRPGCVRRTTSAGVKKSVRTNRGNVWLKTTLTRSAWAATNRKESRLQSRYHARCGNKRAIVALGHMLLKTIHAVLLAKLPYREDPPITQEDRNVERAQHHLRCLKMLGYNTFAVE